MEKKRVEELVSKYNEGAATLAEVQLIEQLIESGEVSLTQLTDLHRLEMALESTDAGSPTLRLDDQFYSILAQEKRKQQKPVFQLPDWSTLLPRFAFAASFLIIGFVGAYVFIGRMATPEVQQLTQEVSDLKEMMMLSLLEKESATDRLRAVSLSSEMDQASTKVTDALLKTLNNDQNVNVRLAALDALRPYVRDSSVRMALVKSITQQESPLVQVALAELMAALQEKKSIKEFDKMLKNKNTPEDVKRKIKENLQVLI